jgi:hypothetical protein
MRRHCGVVSCAAALQSGVQHAQLYERSSSSHELVGMLPASDALEVWNERLALDES